MGESWTWLYHAPLHPLYCGRVISTSSYFRRMKNMKNEKMLQQSSSKKGFLAALDQSGGATPGALPQYGVPDSDYHGDAEMFQRMHEMRVRVMTAPSFSGDKIIGAILFEGTMNGM